MSEGKRKCDPDEGYGSSTDKIQKIDSHGMSNGVAASSQVIGTNEGNTVYNHGTVTNLTVTNNYIDGDNLRRTGSVTDATKENGVDVFPKRSRTWSYHYDGKFISTDTPVHGTIDFDLKVITEQLNEQHGTVRCLSTPNLIPLLGLRGVGERPDGVTHYFVLMAESYNPVVFVVTESESKDMTQYLRRLSQAVSVALRGKMNRSVTVSGRSICKADLNYANIWEKVTLHHRELTQSESESQWRALRQSLICFGIIEYKSISPWLCSGIVVNSQGPLSLYQVDIHDDELSLPTVPFRNGYRRNPSEDTPRYMKNIEAETTMRIMGSEKTMFFETNSEDQRTIFGLEMAYRFNLDGGALLIGNPGMKIPTEVCQEVVQTRPITFNEKDRVLGCKHVVVFADKEEDLDQYKTILRSGGKLLVFLLRS